MFCKSFYLELFLVFSLLFEQFLCYCLCCLICGEYLCIVEVVVLCLELVGDEVVGEVFGVYLEVFSECYLGVKWYILLDEVSLVYCVLVLFCG